MLQAEAVDFELTLIPFHLTFATPGNNTCKVRTGVEAYFAQHKMLTPPTQATEALNVSSNFAKI